jgi:hypothetical protein
LVTPGPDGPAGPGGPADRPALEYDARLDQRDAFDLTSPRGTLRLADGILSWQPRGWRAPVWSVPCAEVVGGAAAGLTSFELWLETAVTGTVAVRLEPPGGWWAVGGGNAPDLRGQVLLDGFVRALRGGGARIAGEPRSMSSLPGTAGGNLGWPF